MINDEAGSRNEEVVHPVESPTDRLCVNSVMRDSSTGLINHLMNTDKKEVGVEQESDKYRVLLVSTDLNFKLICTCNLTFFLLVVLGYYCFSV